MKKVTVIGAGLAGSEAAFYIASKGFPVTLVEMRGVKSTPAHHTSDFAELVCSNSLRSNDPFNAVGLLKEEMRQLGSLIIEAADRTQVPAGSALAVDREAFSQYITAKITSHPLISVVREELTTIPEGPTIIATGPLTSDALSHELHTFFGEEHLHFFDAAAPIVDIDSVDMNHAYFKSRYDKGDADYLNCPLTKDEYEQFYQTLMNADTVVLREFEKEIFEGCMPVEVMGRRGEETLLYGPLKPVGLEHNGQQPYAVVQLRKEKATGSLYNLVGFQTNLTFKAQKALLHSIPALKNVEIVRYGVMHRNTYLNSPRILKPTYQTKERDDLFIAGQLTGVEGYVESAASGLVAAINMVKLLQEEPLHVFSSSTMIGALANYISNPLVEHFQPMNANFGLVKEIKVPKKIKKQRLSERALSEIASYA
jgi:methylenetetrahydrofolate--tRNA-(uracil-5-)-methyltransferase